MEMNKHKMQKYCEQEIITIKSNPLKTFYVCVTALRGFPFLLKEK